MKDYRAAIQGRYFTLLSAALSVPVYDVNAVPESATYPHVQIGEMQESELSDMTTLGSLLQADVRIINRAVTASSPASIYALANDIKQTIRPRPGNAFDSVAGLNIVGTTLINQVNIPKVKEAGYFYSGLLLRFQHIIEQLEV